MRRPACVWWLVLAPLAWACESYDPGGNAGAFEPCCGTAGVCVPGSLVAATAGGNAGQLVRDECAPDLLCAPSELVVDPMGVLPSCRASSGGEGRCLPRCLPKVIEQEDQLDRDSCASDALCVPCNNPLTGEDTGACSLGPDKPHEPKLVYPSCCEELGRCIPREVVQSQAAPEDLERLGSDSCENRDQTLCVPSFLVEGGHAPTCRAAGGLEGRCLPGCLTEGDERAGQLRQGSCGDAQVCAPCFNPLDGEDTRACRLAGDQPKEPPHRFANCCGRRGRCVPRELLRESADPAQIARLGEDTCDEDEEALCVPEAWLDASLMGEDLRLSPCHALGQSEGRCVSSCLPDIAAQQDQLERASCAEGELCAPCYHPLSGEDTGVCRLGDDAPQAPPKLLSSCCDTRGRCVPRELLESAQPAETLSQLGPDTCGAADGTEALCVPAAWLDTDSTLQSGPALEPCRSLGQFEGRCLSTCLPKLAEQAQNLTRETCAEGELCAPCFDPRSGEDTQACHVGGDAPREPATTFEACCGQGDTSRGACLPKSLLPADQADALPVEACSSADTRCAPRSLVRDPEGPLPSCTTTGGVLSDPAPGVCLASCFVTPAAVLVLGPGSCSTGELCIPCSAVGDTVPGCS